MTDLQKAKELITDTVRHYTVEDNPLSIHLTTSLCMYKGENGEKCAYGRLLSEEDLNIIDKDLPANK